MSALVHRSQIGFKIIRFTIRRKKYCTVIQGSVFYLQSVFRMESWVTSSFIELSSYVWEMFLSSRFPRHQISLTPPEPKRSRVQANLRPWMAEDTSGVRLITPFSSIFKCLLFLGNDCYEIISYTWHLFHFCVFLTSNVFIHSGWFFNLHIRASLVV